MYSSLLKQNLKHFNCSTDELDYNSAKANSGVAEITCGSFAELLERLITSVV